MEFSLKTVRYALLTFFVVLCLFTALVLIARLPSISLAISGPNFKAEGDSLHGLTIAVQNAPIPLSFGWEKHRRVVVCDGAIYCTSEHLIADFAQKVNLYRHKSGSIVIVNDIWMMELLPGPEIRIFDMQEEKAAQLREPSWNCGERGSLAETDFPKSLYFKDMDFLGAFSVRRYLVPLLESLIYRGMIFLPSSTHGEELCRYPSRG